MNRTRKVDVETVRMSILGFARLHNVDSAVLMQAMSEISGMVCALCERTGDGQTFDARMSDFLEHARKSYLDSPAHIKRATKDRLVSQ